MVSLLINDIVWSNTYLLLFIYYSIDRDHSLILGSMSTWVGIRCSPINHLFFVFHFFFYLFKIQISLLFFCFFSFLVKYWLDCHFTLRENVIQTTNGILWNSDKNVDFINKWLIDSLHASSRISLPTINPEMIHGDPIRILNISGQIGT